MDNVNASGNLSWSNNLKTIPNPNQGPPINETVPSHLQTEIRQQEDVQRASENRQNEGDLFIPNCKDGERLDLVINRPTDFFNPLRTVPNNLDYGFSAGVNQSIIHGTMEQSWQTVYVNNLLQNNNIDDANFYMNKFFGRDLTEEEKANRSILTRDSGSNTSSDNTTSNALKQLLANKNKSVEQTTHASEQKAINDNIMEEGMFSKHGFIPPEVNGAQPHPSNNPILAKYLEQYNPKRQFGVGETDVPNQQPKSTYNPFGNPIITEENQIADLQQKSIPIQFFPKIINYVLGVKPNNKKLLGNGNYKPQITPSIFQQLLNLDVTDPVSGKVIPKQKLSLILQSQTQLIQENKKKSEEAWFRLHGINLGELLYDISPFGIANLIDEGLNPNRQANVQAEILPRKPTLRKMKERLADDKELNSNNYKEFEQLFNNWINADYVDNVTERIKLEKPFLKWINSLPANQAKKLLNLGHKYAQNKKPDHHPFKEFAQAAGLRKRKRN